MKIIVKNKILELRQIPKFFDYFAIEIGFVYSFKRQKLKKLKPFVDTCDYFMVDLCRNSKKYTKKVHRLVLETFVGPCPDGMQCCHKDGNPKNNHVNNLYWGTHQDNINDRTQHGTVAKGEKHGNGKLSEKEVLKIRELYDLGYSKEELPVCLTFLRRTYLTLYTKKHGSTYNEPEGLGKDSF